MTITTKFDIGDLVQINREEGLPCYAHITGISWFIDECGSASISYDTDYPVINHDKYGNSYEDFLTVNEKDASKVRVLPFRHPSN